MRRIEKAWYRTSVSLPLWLLFPLSLLFAGISGLRRILYRHGIFTSHDVDCPVIIIGNISVGGNGKTPLVLALAQSLKQQGFSPGVLSRGYGGKSKSYPMTVEQDSLATLVGDEPAMMKQRLSCPLVIDPDRVRGATYLRQQHNVNVILCDDGLQHYRLKRTIEIVVMDGERRLGNRQLLPMGPLRERESRLSSVDFVVVNGRQAKQNEFLMGLVAGQLVNVKNPARTISAQHLSRDNIHAIAAIGNPQRFFDTLSEQGINTSREIAFPDHHPFSADELPFDTVVMTEKDAIKCRSFAKDDWWYVPVSAQLPEQFLTALTRRLK